MNKLLIVERNKEQQKILQDSILLNYPGWKIVCTGDYQSAVFQIKESLEGTAPFSLFLLGLESDKEYAEPEGFQLAGVIRSHRQYRTTPLLFLAASPDKIQQAVSLYHCYNYMVKPYSMNDILVQLEQMQISGILSEEIIYITDTSRIQHRIPIKNICYIEAKSHQVQIATPDAIITTRKVSFSTLQKRLTNELMPCHRKYLINLQHVTLYDKGKCQLLLQNYSIPVSRNYRQQVEAALT